MNELTLMGIGYFFTILFSAAALFGITFLIALRTRKTHEKQLKEAQKNNESKNEQNKV